MMETTTKQLYEFGSFRLDMSRRLLLRDGEVVPLTHKAFEMLALMVENSGRVVEKDELLKEIWPDTFVEEGSLSRNISVLRKTLGEGPSDHHYIQTIPKQGYRFVADVREVFDSGDQGAELYQNGESQYETAKKLPSEFRPAENNRSPMYLIGLLLLASVTIIATAVYYLVPRGNSAASSPMTVTRFTNTGKSIAAAISPDGKYVVNVVSESGQQSLWVKQVAAGSQVQIVEPTNVSYQGVAFSGDGNYIYYNVWDKEHVGAIFRIPTLGGAAVKIINDVMPSIAVSPDSRKIAFIRSVAATGDQMVMVANADGTDEHQVIAANGIPKGWLWQQPTWSPDGRTLAFAVGESGEYAGHSVRLITMPVDGGEERIISERRWVSVGGLAWTQDGNDLILAASEQARSPMQLWLVSYPNGSARQITNDVNGYYSISLTADSKTLVTVQQEVLSNVWVANGKEIDNAKKITSGRYEGLAMSWTPDERIVYVSQESGNDDIWIMDSDGGNRKQLTVDPEVDFSPTVSADGRYVVFVSLRSGTPHIWRMDIDGGNQRQLTDGDGEWSPVCSPNGPWIFYVSDHGPGIHKLSLDGGEPVMVTNKYSFLPTLSPDGARMAYSYWDDESKPQRLRHAVISADTGQRLQTFEIPKTAIGQDSWVMLRWSPDGQAIEYIDSRSGTPNVWSQPLAGGPSVQITNFKDGEIFGFDWSRSGKLALTRGTITNDIVLISNFR